MIALCFLSKVNAQEIIKPIEHYLVTPLSENVNAYYRDTNNVLQDVLGTWEYSTANEYFKVTFYKEKVNVNEKYNVFSDALKAKYIYKKNGMTIYDNYGQLYLISSNVNTKPSDLSSSFVRNSIITFSYTEPSFVNCHRRKVGRLKIKRLPGSPVKLDWKRVTDTSYFENEPCGDILPDNSEFLIPANMTLTKIN